MNSIKIQLKFNYNFFLIIIIVFKISITIKRNKYKLYTLMEQYKQLFYIYNYYWMNQKNIEELLIQVKLFFQNQLEL